MVVYIPSKQGDRVIDAEEVAVPTGFDDAEDLERNCPGFLEWPIVTRDDWGNEAVGFAFEGDRVYL